MPHAHNQTDVQPTFQQIQDRAYALYLAEGCPQGRCDAHWNQAEEQLRAELAQAEAPPTAPTVARVGRRRK